MSRQLTRSRNVIRKYLADPLHYEKKLKESAGRPRKLTSRQERSILKSVSNSPKSLNDVKNELKLPVHKSTVGRIIKRSGVIVRQKMAKVPKMTDAHKAARLNFVKNNLTTKWENIVFSDEKKWNLDGPDGNRNYWRDLRKDPQLFSRRNFGGGSVMTWGAFCNGKKLELQFITTKENSATYQATLQKAVAPFFRNRRHTHTFQQDNASIHTSTSTRNWFVSKRIKVLEWPACSPDLNPIENIWGILVRRVHRNGRQFKTVQELKDAIQAEWDALTDAELKNLVASMSSRIVEVIQNNGGETKY
ncbi:Protein CBG26279 [Caenorhabditis briggsae]|uniref:Protein CBG26279 n=1 Tax=Caenorhabditis briggsae TaxID=6238 RepID=B6IJI4_CAEBR|nr:Protein CBG26279 [Caenorhabditis briggsae]CAS00064.1 Protein CBG26279 [Caenorhabditis briggsae]